MANLLNKFILAACSLQRQHGKAKHSWGNVLQMFFHVREESSIAWKATMTWSMEWIWRTSTCLEGMCSLKHCPLHSSRSGDRILHTVLRESVVLSLTERPTSFGEDSGNTPMTPCTNLYVSSKERRRCGSPLLKSKYLITRKHWKIQDSLYLYAITVYCYQQA